MCASAARMFMAARAAQAPPPPSHHRAGRRHASSNIDRHYSTAITASAYITDTDTTPTPLTQHTHRLLCDHSLPHATGPLALFSSYH